MRSRLSAKIFIQLFISFVITFQAFSSPPDAVKKNQSTPFQHIIQKSNRIAITLIGNRQDLSKFQHEWRRIVQNDKIIDFEPIIYALESDSPSFRINFDWFRSQYNINQTTRWVLTNRFGQHIGSGSNIISAEILYNLLIASGEISPLDLMMSFLKNYPNHEFTRYHLISRLSRQINQKQRLIEKPLKQELNPIIDEAHWGLLAQNLEHLLLTNAWLSPQMDISAILPDNDLEQYSPLMKGLYNRIKSRICQVINELPNHTNAIKLLLRIDRVLNENKTIDVLSGITPFQTTFHNFKPPKGLSNHLLMSAKSTNSWEKTIPLLRSLWDYTKASELRDRPRISQEVKLSNLKRFNREKRILEEIWSESLAPLLESLLMTGADEEFRSVLSSLDDRWSILDLQKLLQNLFIRTNSQSKVNEFTTLLSQKPPQPPLYLYGTIPEYQLLSQSQPNPLIELDYNQLVLTGLRIHWIDNIEQWKQDLLKWPPGTPKWGLINPEGAVVLEGNVLPPLNTFIQIFKEKNLILPIDAIRSFLKKNPDHLIATQALASELRQTIEKTMIQSFYLTSPSDKNALQLKLNYIEKFEEYNKYLDTILNHPLGVVASAGIAYINFLPTFPLSSDHNNSYEESLRKIAQKYIDVIEFELKNQPSNKYFWDIWQALGHIVGRPLRIVLDQLVLDPMISKSSFDRDNLIRSYSTLLLADGRWEQVITELEPEWQRYLERTEILGANFSSPLEGNQYYEKIIIPLTISYLHLNQGSKADNIVKTWIIGNSSSIPPFSLIELTKKMGYPEYAESWRLYLQKEKR